jgi:hypothetical protein
VLTTGDWGSAYAQARGRLAPDDAALAPELLQPRHDGARRRACGLRVLHCASEGVAGDGPFWRHRAGLLRAGCSTAATSCA